MATTRIMPLHVGKGRTESRAISDIIDYVANPQKTDNGRLIAGFACDSRTVDAEFLLAKRQYIVATGRVRGADDVIAYHVRQSFRPGEITPEEANRLGVEFAKRFTKGNHAFVVCTHIDKSHIHNHIIWSSVSLEYDRKFRNFWGSTKAVRQLSDTICVENGLSIVENPKPHGKSYNKWLGDQAKPSHRELLRVAIDNALSQSPADFEELLKLLQEYGCEVSKRGKSYRLKLSGWEKAARMDSLGEGYGLEDLRAVLSGKKAHTPRKKTVTQAEPPKINLLVDIQAKLQAGKGAGYARWAKVFNLKQMAQTMNYLSEHNLLEYAVLEEKAAAATAHHNELSAQIKAAEKRMAEIAVLRTHIVNYAKTREVYVAYRKAGYSKKFREEHEEEILLHQAAKNAFDEMGVKKLPKVKELQTEYAKLLEEKKKTYAEYRHSREEMRELLTAKAKDLHIEKLRNRNIFELSGGEKQKIAFASVYAMNPEIYLLDEPSSNLDMASIQELKEHLRLIKSQGKTILIAEHRLYYLMELADRIVYLEDGEIARIFTPEEFLRLPETEREHMGLRAVDLARVLPPASHPPISSPTLALHDVTLRYKKRTILHQIALSAAKGEVIGVVGHNGAGKTTFSRALCGLHKDCEGAFLWDDQPMEHKARLKRSYMVMQDVNYELFAESVGAECSFGIRNPDQDLVEETMKELGLTAYRERHPNTLSGGQKQRVAVAVSMICGKDLLVFDEPTSGLDFDSMAQVAGLIKRLSEQGKIIFIVTHDFEFVCRTCSRVLHFDEGEMPDDIPVVMDSLQKLRELFSVSERKEM